MERGINRQVVLRCRPHGTAPAEGDFELRTAVAPEPGDGEILVRTLMLSVEPAMRGWVLEAPNYLPAVPVGGVMRSFGVSEVVESRSTRYRPGDIVTALTGWQDWAVIAEGDVHRKVDPGQAPISTALGVLGLNGLTAYVGIVDIARPQTGSTVLVSTAAGSVGSAAGQLAKIQGARAVGLAGSEEKVRICVDEFGFDACLNYRATPDLASELGRLCPEGIDVYFDSVGGPMLDAVLDHVNIGARIVICGTIGLAGDPAPRGPRVERKLLVKRASMHGFLAFDHFDRAAGIANVLAEWVRDGRLRYREEISEGLEDAPRALAALLAGANLGKTLVHVADAQPR